MDKRSARTDLVVLLPGLWMPAWVMRPLAWSLRSRGIRCVCFGYPSSKGSIAQNADRLAAYLRSVNGSALHLVGHSLGGVLALHATASYGLARVHRIVMLGSPAQGSYAAEQLAKRAWSRRLLGHTVPHWTAPPRLVAPNDVAVGVVCGTRACGLGRIFVPDLEPPHDGVVRVAETFVSGAADRIEVPVSHSGMLTSPHVAALVAAFVRHGRFELPARRRPASVSGAFTSAGDRKGAGR